MRPNKQQLNGVVYFFRWGSPDGPIKIGFTKTSVRRRIIALQQSSPYEIEWLGYFAGTYLDERAAHRRLHAHKLRGEWFLPHKDVFDFIQEKCPNFDAATAGDIVYVPPVNGKALDAELSA
jgi:hypothetical protein